MLKRVLKKMFQTIKQVDKKLLFIMILLLAFGTVMIFSSSNVAAYVRLNRAPDAFFKKQIIVLAISLSAFFVFLQTKTTVYSSFSWLAIVVMIGLLVWVILYGTVSNDSKSWIDLGFFHLQPSELVKVVLIVWFSAFFEANRGKLDKLVNAIFPIGVVLLIAGLVVGQRDFGTAAIILLISFLLYFLIPLKRTNKLLVTITSAFLIVTGLFLFYVITPEKFERQIERITQYQNPCQEEKFYTTGNQVCNAYIAFNNGSLFGKGLGNSTQKHLYLAEPHTDFIFAIIVEELGLVGGIFLLVLYFIMLIRIVSIGKKSSTSRGSVMCYGVAIYIFIHIAINLLGIMGWMPLTGIPLPFLSYGGSYTLSLVVAIAIVQRVAIEANCKKLGIKC